MIVFNPTPFGWGLNERLVMPVSRRLIRLLVIAGTRFMPLNQVEPPMFQEKRSIKKTERSPSQRVGTAGG